MQISIPDVYFTKKWHFENERPRRDPQSGWSERNRQLQHPNSESPGSTVYMYIHHNKLVNVYPYYAITIWYGHLHYKLVCVLNIYVIWILNYQCAFNIIWGFPFQMHVRASEHDRVKKNNPLKLITLDSFDKSRHHSSIFLSTIHVGIFIKCKYNHIQYEVGHALW